MKRRDRKMKRCFTKIKRRFSAMNLRFRKLKRRVDLVRINLIKY